MGFLFFLSMTSLVLSSSLAPFFGLWLFSWCFSFSVFLCTFAVFLCPGLSSDKTEREKKAMDINLTLCWSQASMSRSESSFPSEGWLLCASLSRQWMWENGEMKEKIMVKYLHLFYVLDVPFSTSWTRARGLLLSFLCLSSSAYFQILEHRVSAGRQ